MAKREGGSSKRTPQRAPKIDKGRARQMANAAAGAVPNVKVSSQGEEHVFDVNYKRIAQQYKVLAKAREVVREETGRLGELYGAAKEQGVKIAELKKAIKIAEQKPGDVAEEMREVGWMLHRMKAPVAVQLGLFTFGEPTLEEFEILGEQAGRNGTPIENAPGKPTDDKYIHWISGYKKGQADEAKTVFQGTGKPSSEDEKIAEENKLH